MKRVLNQNRSHIIAAEVSEALTLFARMKGLLGRDSLAEGQGLWISPCSSIHTFFMRFTIDACFLDAHNRVVGMCKSIRPFRMSRWVPTAVGVLELPSGVLERAQVSLHDTLVWEQAS